jgi:SAM-dependent methyltransferase
MSQGDHFEAYGAAAAALSDPTVSAGRHSFQREEERLIPDDVAHKLALTPTDRLLEIGCGTGTLLRPLVERVESAVGVDHASCVGAFDPVPERVSLVSGQWPEVEVEGDFGAILVYSVLHYLPGREQAFAFIDRCLEVARPGARILLGDLPNPDAEKRFAATEFGERFLAGWRDRVAAVRTSEDAARDEIFAAAPKLERYLDDAFIAELFLRYRGEGKEVYVVPQPVGLPFAYTREDVLIRVRA